MRRHIPNIITACNLICGCIATWAAFIGSFTQVDMQKVAYLPGAKFAFLFIILGAVFDFFDGLVARKLGVSGPLGIQLDSLADVITFGLAPSALIFSLFTKVYYPEIMYEPLWFKIMPFTAFLLPAFAAFRLAKFNIDTRQQDGFIGLPTPASAIFWASLICGCSGFLTSHRFNAPFLVAHLLLPYGERHTDVQAQVSRHEMADRRQSHKIDLYRDCCHRPCCCGSLGLHIGTDCHTPLKGCGFDCRFLHIVVNYSHV